MISIERQMVYVNSLRYALTPTTQYLVGTQINSMTYNVYIRVVIADSANCLFPLWLVVMVIRTSDVVKTYNL